MIKLIIKLIINQKYFYIEIKNLHKIIFKDIKFIYKILNCKEISNIKDFMNLMMKPKIQKKLVLLK